MINGYLTEAAVWVLVLALGGNAIGVVATLIARARRGKS